MVVLSDYIGVLSCVAIRNWNRLKRPPLLFGCLKSSLAFKSLVQISPPS